MKRLVILGIALQFGCAAATDGARSTPEPETASTNETLSIGSRGDDVRALYEYLTRYGYFPNPDLEAQYPGFTPLVAAPPGDPGVYDGQLAEAVLRYQENMGLPATGEADAATLALMRQARCPWPDGYHGGMAAHAHEDGTVDKFSHLIGGRQNWTWSVDSWPSGVSESTVINLTQQMIDEWKRVYPATLQRVARGQGQVKVTFTTIDGPVNPAAINPDGTCNLDYPNNGCVLGRANGLQLDREEAWEFSGTPSAGEIDYRSIALHEIGHLLGLDHSDRANAVMYANNRGMVKRSIQTDDSLSVRSKYALWQSVVTPAKVTDVGAAGRVYWISDQPTGGGYKIYRWISGTNHEALNGGAVRVAVDGRERAWVVNDAGSIYYRAENNSAWRQVSGCARDIAVVYDGPVVVVGCNGRAYVGNMNPNQPDSGLDQQRNAGFTLMNPTGSHPQPTFTNVSGFARGLAALLTDSTGRVWLMLPGLILQPIQVDNPIVAHDIGASLDGESVWATRRDGGNKGIFALNVQSERVNTPRRSGWVGYATAPAMRVTVATNGKPYYVNEAGTLMTTTK